MSRNASLDIEPRNIADYPMAAALATPERPKLLMVTSIAAAPECAAALGTMLRFSVDRAVTRVEGLAALRAKSYDAVVVDSAIADSDAGGAELLRKYAGEAVVLEINFAISGVGRLAREVSSGIARREQDRSHAMRLARAAIESDLKATLAGLLLQSQLALAEPEVSPQLSNKLHQVVLLAVELRQRLQRPFQTS